MEQRQVEAQLCVLPTQRLDFLIGALREFCRAWPNQSAVTVNGAHFLPEDSPEEVVQPGQVCRQAASWSNQIRTRLGG
jgi:hypothetical protein